VLYLCLASPVALIALLIFPHRYEHRMLDGAEGNPQGARAGHRPDDRPPFHETETRREDDPR
jgi:hypothetical protein